MDFPSSFPFFFSASSRLFQNLQCSGKHSLHNIEKREPIHYFYLFICHVLTIYITASVLQLNIHCTVKLSIIKRCGLHTLNGASILQINYLFGDEKKCRVERGGGKLEKGKSGGTDAAL